MFQRTKICYVNLDLHILKFFLFILIKILLGVVNAFRTRSLLMFLLKLMLSNTFKGFFH